MSSLGLRAIFGFGCSAKKLYPGDTLSSARMALEIRFRHLVEYTARVPLKTEKVGLLTFQNFKFLTTSEGLVNRVSIFSQSAQGNPIDLIVSESMWRC